MVIIGVFLEAIALLQGAISSKTLVFIAIFEVRLTQIERTSFNRTKKNDITLWLIFMYNICDNCKETLL